MTNLLDHQLIDANLTLVLNELEAQPEVAQFYPPTVLPYKAEMAQIREFIDQAGEYGLAYEYINGVLKSFPFSLSGKAAVKLLEVALLMGFKSERECDKRFDRRVK